MATRRKTQTEVKREQVAAMVAAWAAERITVTGDRTDRITMNEALSDLDFWAVWTERERRPEGTVGMAREAIADRLVELGAGTSGRSVRVGVRIEDRTAQASDGSLNGGESEDVTGTATDGLRY